METRPLVVCGWYTPDYAHWLPPLLSDLGKFGHEHWFNRIPKPAGSRWETMTLEKPRQVILAMQRFPDRAIVFIDVDARVLAPLDELAEITTDVAFFVRAKFRRRGGIRFGVRSGTLVFRPTEKAMGFAHFWYEAARNAPFGSEDQQALAVALGRVRGLTFTTLDNRFCAVAADDVEHPAILHDSASKGVRKVKNWQKTLWWLRRVNWRH